MNEWEQDAPVAPWEADAPVTPPAQFTRPVSDLPEKSKHTTNDELTDASTTGRVLDAFGQGLKDGWGAEPLGLSPDSEKWLRDNKIFDDYQETVRRYCRNYGAGCTQTSTAVPFDDLILKMMRVAGAVG